MRSTAWFWSFLALVLITLAITITASWYLWHTSLVGEQDRLSNVGGILQGTLGVAVALAGAIVAIRIASLTNQMIKREQLREDFDFLNERLEQGLKPVFEVGRDLVALYQFFIIYASRRDELVREMSKQLDQKTQDSKMEAILSLRRGLGKRFLKLADSLDNLFSNGYALFIWTRGVLGKGTTAIEDDNQVSNINLQAQTDVAEISSLLRARGQMLELETADDAFNLSRLDRIFAYMTTAEDGNPFDDKALRDLIELGFVTLTFHVSETKVRNVGLRIIYDLAKSVPTQIELKQTVDLLSAKIFPDEVKERSPIYKLSEEINPQMAFGVSFKTALQGYERRRPLEFVSFGDKTA